MKEIKLNLGCGRQKLDDYIGIDIEQVVDSRGDKKVDIVLDLEKETLPFKDGEVSAILADNVLEHLDNLRGVLNECWRVLKVGGELTGCVPICGTMAHYKDPTHRRCFVVETFAYFTGQANWDPTKPSRPKYADYGFKPWNKLELKTEGELIKFRLSPRK